MNLNDAHLTTQMVWMVTFVVACVDGLLILGVWRLFPKNAFSQMPGWVALVSFAFFAAVWTTVLTSAWDWFYAYVFPAWVRPTGLIWGLGYGAAGLGMWWLSQRLPGKAAVNFCLLGGLEGLITHIWAIYGLGAASNPPLMQGVDRFPVLIFAVFEKAFYWIIILMIAYGLSRLFSAARSRLTVQKGA